ncbi:MAG: PEP-CTERM sorting domain-containing protein [Sedimentisphaerales bacterium]
MYKLEKAIAVMILLLAFLTDISNAGYTWTGDGHYDVGGQFGYPGTDLIKTYDNVTVDMYTGGAVSEFDMYGNSKLTMYDGFISELNLYQNTTATIFAANINNLLVNPASTGWVKLYAHDVFFFPSSGPTDGGSMVGYWISNNRWFDVYFKGDRTQGEITRSFIQVVPEPASAVLFALGSLFICSRRRRKFQK